MKSILIIVICFGHWACLAQVKTTWKGGTPGMETSWHCPQNWNNYRTPDSFSNVLIPDVSNQGGYFPTIARDAGCINTLVIESGAQLTISASGALSVILSEGSLLVGEMLNQGNFRWIPRSKDPTKRRRASNSLASMAKQYSTVLSATDAIDWR